MCFHQKFVHVDAKNIELQSLVGSLWSFWSCFFEKDKRKNNGKGEGAFFFAASYSSPQTIKQPFTMYNLRV